MANGSDTPPHPNDVALGKRIRSLRMLRGLSQEQLAEASGVSSGQIEKYESGAHRASVSMLARISRTLGVPIAELFEEEDAAPTSFDDVTDLLITPGAIELLKAYAALPRGMSRSALVAFVSSFRPPST